MKAQIKATLLQIPSVTAVTISINNSPQSISDLRANIPNAMAASPVTLDPTGIYGSSGQPIVSLNAAGTNLLADATDFALNTAADNLALLSGGSLYRIRLNALDKSPKVVDNRVNLLAPEFDSYGYLWSVGSSVSSAWLSVGAQTSHRISTRNLMTTAVKAFSISPDGARVAVLYAGTSPGVWVHTVKRNSDGQPLELGAGIKLDNEAGAPISVQWADAVNLAVLTKFDGEGVRPTVVMLGGETKIYPVILGGAKMLANLATPNILVIRRDGTVFAYKSNSWVQIAKFVRAIHLSTLQ
jgi:hypothetical protein